MSYNPYLNFEKALIAITKRAVGVCVSGLVFVGTAGWLIREAHAIDPYFTVVVLAIAACCVSAVTLLLFLFPDW